MHSIDSLWLFVLVTMASVITLGPAVLLALRNGGAYGAKLALLSSLGNVLGASHTALWLKRFAGLLFLGMAMILMCWKPGDGR
jgi:threonine/homoserine/homoserine lactone efflux protein